MYKASASGAIDSGLIPIQIKPMSWKFVFTAFILDAQLLMSIVANKLASLLVVLFGKAFSLISHLKMVGKWPTSPYL